MTKRVIFSAACVAFAVGCCRPPVGHAMVDAAATEETRALYSNLFGVTDRGVMFGHQDDTVYGVGWSYEEGRSDVKSVAGDYPAVYGWELGGLELGWEANIDQVPFGTMKRHIEDAYARGGVNTISWHPHNPESGLTAWDGHTTTAVAGILPGGENHAKYLMWLDRVAAFLGSLEGAGGEPVPVIWRMFHEHTATGFWWASWQCTPAEYIALWQFTVGYLRDEKGLHNLIYCYSPDIIRDRDHYLERWPGDEWVDMLGLDAYHRQDEWDFLSGADRMLSVLTELGAEKGKPTAFTETGLEAIPDPHWWTGQLLPVIGDKPLSYVLVWRNAYQRPNHWFAPYPGSVSAEDFVEFRNNGCPGILFESDLPDMYKK